AWLDERSPKERARVDDQLFHLQSVPTPDERQLKSLSGDCDGLYELRFKFRNVQWRPLACYGPGGGEMTILYVAKDANDRFEPLSACRSAKARRAIIHQDRGRSVKHAWG